MAIRNLTVLKNILAPGKRLLGLDFGTKRIGLALSDPTLCVASPLDTLLRSRLATDVATLATLVDTWKIGGFVLGLPLHMQGHEGQAVRQVRRFAAQLITHTYMFHAEPEIAFWDERWSTVAVTRSLRHARLTRAQRAKVIDRVSATYILQGALDALRIGGRESA